MTSQLQFRDIKNPQDLATFLGISYGTLIYYTYRMDSTKKYRTFTIKKRNGKDRIIISPCYPLKLIQQKLHQALQDIYIPRNSSHGFVRKRSIKTNASLHLSQPWIFTLDIEEFFPSITYQRIRGLFQSKPFSFSREVSQILAHLCCYEKKLPQGAPTSPIISNMICVGLDRDLQKLAKRLRCNYTRYADDITFSPFYSSRFPSGLGIIDENSTIQLSNEISSIFQRHSFTIHPNKVRLSRESERQNVTGVIVNQKLNVRRTYIRRIRAMLYYWKLHGLDEAQNKFISTYKPRNRNKQKQSFYKTLLGMISFVGYVRGKNDGLYIRLMNEFRRNDPNWNTKNTLDEEQVENSKKLSRTREELERIKVLLKEDEEIQQKIEHIQNKQHLMELKTTLVKRKNVLEIQIAHLGIMYVPAHKTIELEDCEREIQEIDNKLQGYATILGL